MTEGSPRRAPRPIEPQALRPRNDRVHRDVSGQPTGVPVWMLDVDGVLNAFNAGDRAGFSRGVANGYLITWDQTLTDRIHQLHVDGLVEIRWLTTWADLANTYISPLFGWTEFVVAGTPALGLEWWKFQYAAAVVEIEDRPLVWTDDDLETSRPATSWLHDRSDEEVLAICTDPATGLTHAELDQVEQWLIHHVRT